MSSELFDLVRALTEHVARSLGYGGVAALAFADTGFPPLPSELVVPFAGILVARGEMTAPLALLASTAGSLAGALALYALGARLGEAALRRLVRRRGRWVGLRERELDRGLELFRRHGRAVVFWARLMPGVRSAVSIPAGIVGMPPAIFALVTALGAGVWNGALLAAGIAAGRGATDVLAHVERVGPVLLAVAALGTALLLMLRGVRRRAVAMRPVAAGLAGAAPTHPAGPTADPVETPPGE